MSVQNDIDLVSHDLRLARLGLRPEQIPDLMARLAELRAEKWRQFEEGLSADEGYLEKNAPKEFGESCLKPMGMDQYLNSHGEICEQDCEERPDR